MFKVRLPIGALGVHQKNRGGVYPAGVRCKSLCEDVVDAGFSSEVVNQNCVAVEEILIEHYQRRGSGSQWQLVNPAGQVSGWAYKVEKSKKD